MDDIFLTEDDDREVHRRTGSAVRELHRPLGRECDPCAWITEARAPPWAVYVLVPAAYAQERINDAPG